MIEVLNLSKNFNDFCAVNQISFSIPKGQILGFLGPNGAGKSTTMKIITCFMPPTSGAVKVDGLDTTTQAKAVKSRIGYLPESAASYSEMSVAEFLDFIAEIRGLPGKSAQHKMKEVCFLEDVWHQPISTLSKGFKQRVGFAQALIHDPPVLILDEPTDGLDPNQKHEVRQLIKSMSNEKTIVLSTHILEEVEAVCERLLIIAQGQIVADSTPEELKTKSSFHNAVTLNFTEDQKSKALQSLKDLSEISHVEELPVPNSIRVFPKNGKAIIDVVAKTVKEKGIDVNQIHVDKGRLDDVFRAITLKQ